MSARRSAHLNVMIEAAEKAGRALIRDFGEVEQLQVSRKGPGDFVSTADLKSEKIIYETLLKARPKYSFLLEERGSIKGEDTSHRWIADPLDGTINFLHGMPHWCISIALEKEGEIVSAVVHDPIKNETFTAEKGFGAFSNSKRLRVAGKQTFDETLIALGDDIDLTGIFPPTFKTRSMGSTCLDLAYVAAGRFDAYFKNNRVNIWDKAAGILLIKESGGLITEIDGGRDVMHGNGIATANLQLHPELLKKIKELNIDKSVSKVAN